MKKLIILFFIFTSVLLAEIGQITAINGKAIIFRGNTKIPIKKSTKIEEKDTIKTMKSSKLQMIFKDKTVISLGQKTTFKIQEYLFSKTKPKAKFNISKGIFKSITGKIGKIAPQNFKLKTQNATIGVRGTTIICETTKHSDHIICSSGKIVVTNSFGQVAVNMGERTVVRKGNKPTAVVKISTEQLSQIDKSLKTSPEKIKKVITPTIQNTPKEELVNNKQTKIDNIKNIKHDNDKWGQWNQEKIIDQDKKNDTTKNDKTPQPEEQNTDLPELQELRDRAGGSNPTYSGKVSGFVDTPSNIITEQNNHIELNFDLGKGTMNGDIAFEANNKQWNADIQNGTVDKRGQFDFNIKNIADNLNGNGNGMLSGQQLQNADGSFKLKNETTNKNAFGTFHAKRK